MIAQKSNFNYSDCDQLNWDVKISRTTSTSSFTPVNRPGPVVIDPRKLQEEQRKKIDDEMASSELVANARLMGYSDQSIRAAIKRYKIVCFDIQIQ